MTFYGFLPIILHFAGILFVPSNYKNAKQNKQSVLCSNFYIAHRIESLEKMTLDRMHLFFSTALHLFNHTYWVQEDYHNHI